MLFKSLIIFVSLICVYYCTAQNLNICNSQHKCNDCIQQEECVWCISQNISDHCLHKSEEKKCTINDIEDPKSEVIEIENDPSSLIRPSKLNLKLRPRQPQKIKFTVSQPKYFPVDLYFLLDISQTMQEHRNKLASLAYELVHTMQNFTPDVQMGFGSFVDKPIAPFAYTNAGEIINPCPKMDCTLPYSFQNHLSLTNDTEKFSYILNTTKSSGNVDTPEGSLEALLQAIVCKKEIGWRENARRLIILSTDATFHIAGDGKLAGIDLPNDGLCHLENNFYSHSLLQDYPSVGQVVQKVKESNIIVIFAVTESARSIFEQLRDRIHNSFVEILSTRKSITEILKKIYYNITTSVKINHDFGENFEITFIEPNSKNFDKINASYTGIKPGENISFTAEIKLKKCPKMTSKSMYRIYPSGLNKFISVQVEYLCHCQCEKLGVKIKGYCSDVGEMQCGICNCPSNKIGPLCECDKNGDIYEVDTKNCIQENSTELCSGAGYCNCGKCVCDEKLQEKERIYGKHCECSDHSCYDDNDIICSNHGLCSCGLCNCDIGWSGPKCDCTENDDTCKAPNKIDVCSYDKGNCVCGKCKCIEINGYKYSGEYCEICLNCPQCNYYKNCVECQVFKQGSYKEIECEEICSIHEIIIVDDVDTNIGESCSFSDDQNCIIKFKYIFNGMENTTLLYVQKEKLECIEAANITLWAGIPIISILVATLIALAIFKVITTLQYQREYANFLKEKELERNELNPLYKSPTVTVMNPTYGQHK